MGLGLASGLFWGLDTAILSLAFLTAPLLGVGDAPWLGAALHDGFAALLVFVVLVSAGRFQQVKAALRTKGALVVMAAALIGGPIGMSGYLSAIKTLGPGLTAMFSAFYPALGSFLAIKVLHERMCGRQILAMLAALGAIMVLGVVTAGGDGPSGSVSVGLVSAAICVVGWGSEAVILAWGMRDQGMEDVVALGIREASSAMVYLLVVVPSLGCAGFLPQVIASASGRYIGLAALSGTVSYLLYYKAINRHGASRAMAGNISYALWATLFLSLIHI